MEEICCSVLTIPRECTEKAMKQKIDSRSIRQNRSLVYCVDCFLFRSMGGVFLDVFSSGKLARFCVDRLLKPKQITLSLLYLNKALQIDAPVLATFGLKSELYSTSTISGEDGGVPYISIWITGKQVTGFYKEASRSCCPVITNEMRQMFALKAK